MTFATSVRHFQNLVMSFHPIIMIDTVEEERVHALLTAACNDSLLQISLFEWSIAGGLYRSVESPNNRWQNKYAPPGTRANQPLDKTADPLDMLRHIQQLKMRAVFWLKDFTPHLKDPVAARTMREIADQFSHNQSVLVLSDTRGSLPPELQPDVVHFDLHLPDDGELYDAINATVGGLRKQHRITIELGIDDMPALVKAMRGMTLKQVRQVLTYCAIHDGELNRDDIQRVLKRKARIIHEEGLLDYIPPEENTAQLGGFKGLKQWLAYAKVGFSPQAQEFNLPAPKGILIVGIQGCGKSLAAKTIARQWHLPLLKLDAGRLYDKYVGESDKNFRRATTLAATMAPCILWIDEIEKSMGQTGSDADGGLSRRLFGYFLTWLQEKSHEIFVVATANDLSMIPPELLRKGRFDEIFYVDLPEAKERGEVIAIHLSRHNQPPQAFRLQALIEATAGFSGAEIEQAIIRAHYVALSEDRPVDTELLLSRIQHTVPLSVSRREDIERLRAIARERFVPVH